MGHGWRLAGMALAGVPALALAQATLALAQSGGVTPGMWETAVTIDSVEMPGGPAFVAKMMQGKTTRVKQCLSAADAARGPQDMLKASKTCTFTRYTMANGRLDSAMTCTNGGQTTTATSSGSFTPTGFTATGRSVTTGTMPMTVRTTATGRLVGACK